MEVIFEKIVVVGSGKFPFQCTMLLKSIYSNVEIYEYKVSEMSVLDQLCKKNEIGYKVLDKLEMDEELRKISNCKLLIVSAFNTYLFQKDLIKKENVTIINYHNAYLPDHPGRNAEAWIIFEGNKEAGVTWHFVEEEIDAGKIIIQQKFSIDNKITSIKLLQKQNKLSLDLFEGFIKGLLAGNIQGKAQSGFDKSKMHFSKSIPNKGLFDLSWNTNQMSRFLRAMDYGIINLLGIAQIRWQEKNYYIRNYKIQDSTEEEKIEKEDDKIIICKEGKKIALKIELVN